MVLPLLKTEDWICGNYYYSYYLLLIHDRQDTRRPTITKYKLYAKEDNMIPDYHILLIILFEKLLADGGT